ncbi:hypothetical protein PORCAN_2077 [Porphyromonas crevioricanis JCM 13913]|nr:hypothetical protein PORCAN_2077 [Porphyromonas crevioricanis JCM 13913]
MVYLFWIYYLLLSPYKASGFDNQLSSSVNFYLTFLARSLSFKLSIKKGRESLFVLY